MKKEDLLKSDDTGRILFCIHHITNKKTVNIPSNRRNLWNILSFITVMSITTRIIQINKNKPKNLLVKTIEEALTHKLIYAPKEKKNNDLIPTPGKSSPNPEIHIKNNRTTK
jgi:hypothetical protein